MDTTRASLIVRIRNRDDSDAWTQFHELYGPLLYRYARARGLSSDDAEEIKSQCLAVVVQQIGNFEYNRAKGGFKNWLRRIAYNKIMDVFRNQRTKSIQSGEMRAIADTDPSPDQVWEAHWQHAHLKYCVEQVGAAVSPQNYRAFYLLVFEEQSVEEVSTELGMNANQVYKAKSRVLERIRIKMSELDVE